MARYPKEQQEFILAAGVKNSAKGAWRGHARRFNKKFGVAKTPEALRRQFYHLKSRERGSSPKKAAPQYGWFVRAAERMAARLQGVEGLREENRRLKAELREERAFRLKAERLLGLLAATRKRAASALVEHSAD